MKVEKADYPWIIDIFYQHFSYGLSRICNADFLQKRYIEFRKKQDPIYLSLLDGMKDDSLSKTFVSYWTIAQTIATQSRFWIEDAITEFLISLAKRRNKNDLRVYSQSMLGDGWMDRGISVVDIGEKDSNIFPQDVHGEFRCKERCSKLLIWLLANRNVSV